MNIALGIAATIGAIALSISTAGDARARGSDGTAKEEFKQGSERFRADDYEAALHHFRRAYELSAHHPPTILALAQCERALKMLEGALEHYREYLAVRPRPEDADAVEETVALLERSREPRRPPEAPIVEATVSAAPSSPTAEASPEGTPPPPGSVAKSVPPPPIASSSSPRHAPAKIDATVPAVESTTPLPPSNRLVEPYRATAREDDGASPWRIGLLGVGGAATIAGAVFAVLAASANADVDRAIAAGSEDADLVVDTAKTGFRNAVVADILLGTGAVALLAGILLVE